MVWGSLAPQILLLPLFLPPFSWLFGFSSSFTLSSSASFIFSFTFRWCFWGVWSTGGWVWSFWVRTHFLLLLQSLETDILNVQCVHVVCIYKGTQLYICKSTYFSRSSACKPFTARSAKGQLHEFDCIQHKALSIKYQFSNKDGGKKIPLFAIKWTVRLAMHNFCHARCTTEKPKVCIGSQ